MKFLPAGVSSRITNSADLLGSERIRTVLNGISATFDYIFIDLPPFRAAVDARAISPQIDGFIVIVEWGSTREDLLEEALTSMAVARDKIIGGVLNKVDLITSTTIRPVITIMNLTADMVGARSVES